MRDLTSQTGSFGDRLKARRRELGLSQDEVAKAAGVSRPAVTQWENGDTKSMKPGHLFAVARKLGRNPRWLQTGRGNPDVASTLDDAILALPTEQRIQVLEYLSYAISKSEAVLAAEEVAEYRATVERILAESEKVNA